MAPLVFTRDPLAPGERVRIEFQATRVFRARRLVVLGEGLGVTLIHQLEIAGCPQIATGQFGIPARCFKEEAEDMDIHVDPIGEGTLVLLEVENVGKESIVFWAELREPHPSESAARSHNDARRPPHPPQRARS